MKTAGLTTKQSQRIERKKKKALAYLAIAKLNDQDRYEKQVTIVLFTELEYCKYC